MLVRFVRQQGLTPAEVRSGAPVLASDPAPWASESVAQAWRWGLVAEGADPTGVLTRAQGRGAAGTAHLLKGQSNFWKQRRLFPFPVV